MMTEKGTFTKGFSGEVLSVKNYGVDTLKVLPKSEYTDIVVKQRSVFVHKNFSAILDKLFKDLGEDAAKMKVCHREVEFDIPEHFDVVKTEAILCSYFSDLGYRALPESRKAGKPGSEDTTKISLTLT